MVQDKIVTINDVIHSHVVSKKIVKTLLLKNLIKENNRKHKVAEVVFTKTIEKMDIEMFLFTKNKEVVNIQVFHKKNHFNALYFNREDKKELISKK